MKHLLILGVRPWMVLAIVLITLNIGHGQEVSVGLVGGLNLYSLENLDFNNSDEYTSFGYHGGAEAGFRVKSIAAHIEAVYSFSEFESDVSPFSTTKSFARIELPLLMKYYLFQGLNFQLGAKAGYLLSAKTETASINTIQEFDVSDATNTVDVGAVVGLGYSFLAFDFNARYNIGITDFPSTGSNLGGFQVSIGYAILQGGGVVAGIATTKKKKWKRD